jgi:acyl-CoA synthetase (AMP-forming)/AMP-acid ligase II
VAERYTPCYINLRTRVDHPSYRQNLFPVQIENVLLTHPDIVEAAAIAVPDSHYGEVVGVWIVPRSGTRLSGEDVRAVVMRGMNPQVRSSADVI